MGTSKIVVLMGEIVDKRRLNIIGFGQSTSEGIKKGEIIDLKAASACTHAAIMSAEQSAGAAMDGVFLASTGRHLEGFTHSGYVAVEGADDTVSVADVNQASDNANNKGLPGGRSYLHHIKSGYLLDGVQVEDPVGLHGSHLESRYWHVHGDEHWIRDQLSVINGMGLKVEDMVISSLAAGYIVASTEEKKSGVLVVDIGAGTTDYVLYRNGVIKCSGVISVGGDHFSNDLALGLRVKLKDAERLKLREGKGVIDRSDCKDLVMLTGDLSIGDRALSRKSIYTVLHARADELFTILKNRLGSSLSPQNLPGGIILTGGGSRLPMIDILGETVLGVPVRLGRNPAWINIENLQQTEYCTVMGLLYFGLKGGSDGGRGSMDARSKGWISKVTGIFK